MPDVEIRRLDLDDLALLESVDEGVFDHPVDRDQATAFLSDPSHEMVLALEDGVVLGMASAVVILHPDKRPQMFVNEVGVHERARRRGIAGRLVEALLRVADDRGCTGTWLATELDNAAARGLYARLGARETAGVVVCDWGAELRR